ncbi:MAG: phosphotransferase [Thermoleophilia bacterium]|nr:phosphotransferase [Thermoleophilia bacterium]
MATPENLPADAENPDHPSGRQGDDSATGRSPYLTAREAEEIVLDSYGFEGEAERIAGERDDNFLIRGKSGTKIFLKVAHIHEDETVTNLVTSVLLHVAAEAPELPVQHVVRDRKSEAEVELTTGDGSSRRARVTTYLDGRILRSANPDRELRFELGRTLATLNRTLRTFDHPGLDHQHLLWDVQRSVELRELLQPASRGHDSLAQSLDLFDSDVRPLMERLRTQAVHTDFSRDNILVDGAEKKIVGILDFGDLVRAPLANDLAIAAYQLWDLADPLESAAAIVAGYHEVDELLESEVALLYDLMLMRIVSRIIISEWRADRFPENRDYILRNRSQAWTEFDFLREVSRDHVTERMMQACATGKP